MDIKFKNLISDFPKKYIELISMLPVTTDTIPSDCPVGGIYMFTEYGKHLYVGRTKQSIKDRVRDHISNAIDSPFAWHLARESTGFTKASYKTKGSRQQLLGQPEFKRVYESAKNRISKMEVRYISEPDPVRQALLEIYVAVETGAKYNDFDTH
jgi:hypothetical protein